MDPLFKFLVSQDCSYCLTLRANIKCSLINRYHKICTIEECGYIHSTKNHTLHKAESPCEEELSYWLWTHTVKENRLQFDCNHWRPSMQQSSPNWFLVEFLSSSCERDTSTWNVKEEPIHHRLNVSSELFHYPHVTIIRRSCGSSFTFFPKQSAAPCSALTEVPL